MHLAYAVDRSLGMSKLSFLVLGLLLVVHCVEVNAAPIAMFVFGDSLVDSGNNNYIGSIARANFKPNGIDYPTHQPTGRFCNGKIISDLLSDVMGTPPIKPYLDPTNDEASLSLGANFASAGAGILNTTGKQFLKLLTVEQQFAYFSEYKQKIAGFKGVAAAEQLVSTALFSLTFGGNDYINNYLQPFSQYPKEYTLSQFQDLLISNYKAQLTELYYLGARKISVTALGPLGCIPSQLNIQKSPNGSCIESLQQAALNFNVALKAVTKELNAQLPGVTFVWAESFPLIYDIIQNPTAYGFQVSNQACCGQGKYKGFLICNRFSTVCPDRTKYLFWDPFHPTETANRLVTAQLLDGPPSFISPVNIRHLLEN